MFNSFTIIKSSSFSTIRGLESLLLQKYITILAMLTALRYLKAGDHELSLPVYLFICSGDSLHCKSDHVKKGELGFCFKTALQI